MYDFSSALFWYKIIFMTELLAAEGAFIYLLKERPKFFLRIILSVIGLYAIAFAFPVIEYSAWYVSIMFAVFFIASLVAMKLCFAERWSVILFCGIWAYTVQHFSYLIGNYITVMTGVANGSVYEESLMVYNVGSVLISVASYVVVYIVSLVLIKRLFRNISEIRINGFVLVILSVISLAIEVIINAVVVFLKVEDISLVIFTLCYVYDSICCLLTIALLLFSLRNYSLERDKALMSLMLSKERKNFELNKEKMEKITIMCHDLKLRIRELSESGYTGETLKKLENAINSYDNSYRTGNEVLDIILAEIGERCVANNIQFVCMADGAALEGMETDHIYSLFDNALNNAFDAVKMVSDENKRYIGLQMSRKGSMASIHIENYFDLDKAPVFKDGIPQTTKEDEEWHGFGMRSIQHIVECYDGGLRINVKDDLFALNIFLSCDDNKTKVSKR